MPKQINKSQKQHLQRHLRVYFVLVTFCNAWSLLFGGGCRDSVFLCRFGTCLKIFSVDKAERELVDPPECWDWRHVTPSPGKWGLLLSVIKLLNEAPLEKTDFSFANMYQFG